VGHQALKQRWHVYLLRCRDGSLYCGIALDVVARIALHNAGKGAKYTRSRRPVELAWKKRCRDGTEARKLEARIKRLTTLQKRELVARKLRLPKL
jgi:putative endonuclease